MRPLTIPYARYHLDCITPVRPPMASAIYHAQLCGNGHYRQCIDVPVTAIRDFEHWADQNPGILGYAN